MPEKMEGKHERRYARMDHAIINQTIGYVVAALGLVAGLAWNDAVRSLIEHLFPLATTTVSAKFVYAVLLTLVIALVSIHLVKLQKKDTE
ncbi:MAG: DUF5654 family protein [bacterium]|nr:DUF5654 family protein [bacterium]MDZ4299721.1 DUF5654 family protein [Candidatus Sungbacteria bacterium]